MNTEALARQHGKPVQEQNAEVEYLFTLEGVEALLVAQPQRTLTDEKIAELWHQNGGFHHHFARAVERYLKGEK
jgi:hypothetical protein